LTKRSKILEEVEGREEGREGWREERKKESRRRREESRRIASKKKNAPFQKYIFENATKIGPSVPCAILC
jgi:hypothetical protein